jgi:hypothetical protein
MFSCALLHAISKIVLAHLVLAVSICRPLLLLRLELVINRNVEISSVAVVGSAAQLALDLLASLDGENVCKIEHCLLPVGVLGVRTRAEADGLVAGGELNVEPRNESMDVVRSAHRKREWEAEVEVIGSARVEIERDDGGWVSNDGFELDGIDEGLSEGGDLERGVVEAVDVVPDLLTVSAAVW